MTPALLIFGTSLLTSLPWYLLLRSRLRRARDVADVNRKVLVQWYEKELRLARGRQEHSC